MLSKVEIFKSQLIIHLYLSIAGNNFSLLCDKNVSSTQENDLVFKFLNTSIFIHQVESLINVAFKVFSKQIHQQSDF